jgi:hypothetical protein
MIDSAGRTPAMIRRPFHWGIVFMLAEEQKANIPEPVRDQLVSANESGISVSVRHAQDSDEVEGDYIKFAEVQIGFRVLDAPPVTTEYRREVFRGTIDLPSGRLNVGDADEETIVNGHRGPNTIIVSVNADVARDEVSPDALWIDLLPAETSGDNAGR